MNTESTGLSGRARELRERAAEARHQAETAPTEHIRTFYLDRSRTFERQAAELQDGSFDRGS